MSVFDHKKCTDEQLDQMERMREEYKRVMHMLERLPDGRYKALAMTHLEMSAAWANKAVTHES